MRRLTQVFDDGTLGEWWVNDRHVVEVFPHGTSPKRAYVVTHRDTTQVEGFAMDVARELNGYFDE